MKRVMPFIIVIVIFSAFKGDDHTYNDITYDSFQRGERLEYKVGYGIFNIGSAEMIIDEKNYRVNHRDCYKVDVFGRTTGMVDWIANVEDHWGAYVDSTALVPHISYRNIKEGKYRKNEVVRFDHRVGLIEAKVVNKKTGEFKEPKVYVATEDVRDMLAGYLYLRTIDFSKMKKGQKFKISGFFEDAFYELDVMYKGKDRIKTKAGKFNAIKLEPIMPNNKLFDGEDSILAWISDDANKVPLRVDAKMFIGSFTVELSDYQNLRHNVNRTR